MRRFHVLFTLSIPLCAIALPAQVPVRNPEGTVHGFLELRTAEGELLAHGDLLQTVRDGGVDSRMLFHFADTSNVFEETVRFTQDGVFRMRHYHLVQRGPRFPFALDATVDENGEYVVKTTSKAKGAREEEFKGKLKLPADAANGIAMVLAKNVSASATTRVHIVAFTPEPRVIELEIRPVAPRRVEIGGHTEHGVEFALEPKLGALLTVVAKIAGKMPPDSHAWIDTTSLLAFVRFEGPMYLGAVWTLTLATPSVEAARR